MADNADIANDNIMDAITFALNKRQQNNDPKLTLKFCRECEEEIPLARRNLGFQLCIECAEQSERRKSLFAE